MHPDFLIVGASKSGTTSLYHYLRQHPNIYMSPDIKESYFLCGLKKGDFDGVGQIFARGFVSDLANYLKLFENAGDNQVIGEACGAYLYFYEKTIPKIKSILGPQTKIIICLRNPIERAYSNYLHHVRDGLEPLSFEKALEVEKARKLQGYWWGYRYKDVGFYSDQVMRYLDAFGYDKTLIFLFEEFSNDLQNVLITIFRFLDIEETFIPDSSQRYNRTGQPRSKLLNKFLREENLLKNYIKPIVPSTIRRITTRYLNSVNLKKPEILELTRMQLSKDYKEDVIRLGELISRDLTHWL